MKGTSKRKHGVKKKNAEQRQVARKGKARKTLEAKPPAFH